MDWIRRNWPDLLIGIALVAVIAGIIATLLTGGSFFPLGASQASSSRPDQSSTTPDFETRTVPSEETSRADRAVDTTPVGPSVTAADETDDDAPVTVSALPLPGTSAAGTSEEGSGTSTPASTAQTAGAPTTTTQQTTAADRAGATLPASDEAGVYRISVGAFSGEDNAERQADTFREAGYPVFIGTQGDLSIVLVGPYDDLGEAERVAARIRSGGFRIEPVIYRFQGDSEASSSRARSTSAPAAPAPQPTAAEAAGSFLQVGAYATRESSLPQRERLETLGFRVTERVESDLVKLLVGPFAAGDLTQARALLNEQGIDHFPR